MGLEVVNTIRKRSSLSEEEAMALVDEEKHASRR